MSWKCFFGHKWKMTNSHIKNVYVNQSDELPIETWTLFLFRCQRCTHMKNAIVEGAFNVNAIVEGAFNVKVDDDDDDRDKDREPTPQPQMSPDEYFDLITKD